MTTTNSNHKVTSSPKHNQASSNPSSGEKKEYKMTAKRIAAILGIFILVALYVVTLLVAIFDRSSSGQWFMICLIATVTVPLLIWIYTWMYGVLTNKHTIASFDLLDSHKSDSEDASKSSQE